MATGAGRVGRSMAPMAGMLLAMLLALPCCQGDKTGL